MAASVHHSDEPVVMLRDTPEGGEGRTVEVRSVTESLVERVQKRLRFRRAVLQFAFTAVCIALTLVWVDFHAIYARLMALERGWSIAAMVAFLPLNAFQALRWWMTSRRVGVRLDFRHAIVDVYLSTCLSMILLGFAGDAMRIYRHGQRLTLSDGRTWRDSLQVAVLERLSGQLVLWIAIATCLTLWFPQGHLRWRLLVVLGGLCLLFALAAAIVYRFRSLLARRFVKTNLGWLKAVRLTFWTGSSFGMQLLVSTAVLACSMIMFYCSVRATGVELDAARFFQVTPILFGISTLPISAGGLGLREVASAVLFGMIGLSATDGVVASLTFGLLTVLITLPALLVLLRSPRCYADAEPS